MSSALQHTSSNSSTTTRNNDNTDTANSNIDIRYEALPIPSEQPKLTIPPTKFADILESINPYITMDNDIQNILIELSNDFIHNVCNISCQLAKHRQSNQLEARDVEVFLAKQYGIQIPPSHNNIDNTNTATTQQQQQPTTILDNKFIQRSLHKPRITEAHKRRLAKISSAQQSARSQETMQKARSAQQRLRQEHNSNDND